MNTKRKMFIKEWGISILTLALAVFTFLGSAAYLKPYLTNATEVTSEGIEIISTNNSNIEFSTYFINESGEKVETLNTEIDENTYLYVDITVLNEGYFNGTVTLNNNNFKFLEEMEDEEENAEETAIKVNEGVSEITENSIVLEQINAGETRTIKVAVEPIIEETITLDNLKAETEVTLSGEYVNSKNIEKNKYEEITGTGSVELRWVSRDEIEAEISTELLTNSVYEINDEEKRIIQILVNSKITDNSYPVYSTSIKLKVPENVEEIEVVARSVDGTNSNIEFGAENYTYNEEEKTVEITVQNTNAESISWNKECEDTFVVTYVFDVNQYIEEEAINVNLAITTYDSKELTAKENVELKQTENLDGVITYSVSTEDTSIYKGKLYAGEDKEYRITNEINVNYLNVVSSITLNCNESTYLAGEQEGSANIVYTASKINKENFIEIFGEDGYLIFKDENGNEIKITNETETDEEGNITISFDEETKNIEIETSEPKAIGTLKIEYTKKIKNTGYTRRTINAMTGIKETIVGKAYAKWSEDVDETTEEKIINLKETTSEATLEVSTDILYTTETNENVKMTVVLLNNEESKDLYKNPVIKITLPEQVENVTAKCKVLYGNGLELSNATIKEENGKQVLEIALSGTQEQYNTEAIDGTTIIIYADMYVNKLSASTKEEIKLTYTNEFAVEYADEGEQTQKIKIASTKGVITANSIEEYDVEAIGKQDTQTVLLETEDNEKEVTIGIDVINNEGTQISDVAILGKFPTGEDTNLGVDITSEITLLSEKEGIEIYYSDESNPTTDINDETNGWNKENVSTAQTYLILIDNMEKAEAFSASYTITIPANLTYNMEAEEGYSVTYTNDSTEKTKEISATSLSLSTGSTVDIETTIKEYVGGEEIQEGDIVYEGEVVTYEVTLKNTGTFDSDEFEVEFSISDNGEFVSYTKTVSEEDAEDENGELANGTEDYYEMLGTDPITKTISSIEAGGEVTIEYEVKINEDAEDGANLESNVQVIYGDSESIVSISNKINEAEISAEMIMIQRIGLTLEEGTSYIYVLTINNISDNDLSDIEMAINTQYCNLESVEVYGEDEVQDIEVDEDGKFTLDYLQQGGTKKYLMYAEVDYDIENETDVTAGISAIVNDKYRSNQVVDATQSKNISMSMTSDNEGEVIEEGDIVTYNIEIINTGDMDITNLHFEIEQQISIYLSVTKVVIGDTEIEYSQKANNDEEDDDYIENTYTIYVQDQSLAVGDSLNITVETEVVLNEYSDISEDVELISLAAAYDEVKLAETEQVTHILGSSSSDSDDEIYDGELDDSDLDLSDGETVIKVYTKGNDNTTGVTEETQTVTTNSGSSTSTSTSSSDQENTYAITGVAWLDSNQNGQRDSEENMLSGINVSLLYLQDNTIIDETTTSSNGIYSFKEIENGEYVVIFEYDTDIYQLTTYQADDVTSTRNSDVENVSLVIDEEENEVTATDTIVINDSNKTNIDIGLIDLTKFDLSLEKTIASITVANEAGTETTEYNDETLVKAEIKSKYLTSTVVTIEYKIKVTNEGEIAGYAKSIVDYIPSDMSFDESLNSDWYEEDGYIYTSSLENEIIEPGETKELTLILTKTMTETNTGLINNIAEINEDYNSNGTSDTDSTPGNKDLTEDDLGQANAIISVSTGGKVIGITLIVIVAIVAIGASIYFIRKKVRR